MWYLFMLRLKLIHVDKRCPRACWNTIKRVLQLLYLSANNGPFVIDYGIIAFFKFNIEFQYVIEYRVNVKYCFLHVQFLVENGNLRSGAPMVTVSLTHWGWVTHTCISKLTIIGSDNGLSPGRRQAIFWNQWWNSVDSSLRHKLQWNPKRNSFIFIQVNAYENVVCEMASIFSRPQCVDTLVDTNATVKLLHTT